MRIFEETLTRAEWRAKRKISRSHHQALLREDRAPREIDVDGKKLITASADAAWIEGLEREQAAARVPEAARS
jgi:hypothetical protein